jgi:protein-disulfide isomerase
VTIKRIATIFLLALIAASPALAQTSDKLDKTLDQLNQTNQAILKELQEIRRLLQQQQGPPAAAVAPAEALPAAAIDISKEPTKGSTTAKVALIEYSDYQCPFCARYDADAYPQIIKDYVDTGKVKYVWRDLPLDMHPNAFKAAEAAQCAGDQGKFWEMHDRLFKNQQALAPADLTKHAEALGLNTSLFQQCLDSSRHAAEIRTDIAAANSVGIGGTPSFLIGTVQPNGSVKVTKKVVGARGYPDFKAAIEAALNPGTAVK